LLKQAHWRGMGVAFLLGSGVLAAISVTTPILRNTLIWLVSFTNEEAVERAEMLSPWGYLIFWGLFAGCVAGALYMAMLDIRFIRLEYALAKRDLMREAMEEAIAKPEAADHSAPPGPKRT